ncbi:outer membrane beta-barrel protein [Halorhodospira abdelmalekii]|uniref:outer membrane beta-barrel protein n=1 Tax=Halorhodospira abdelmalekii TaxID=421629 RepID=UPI00190608A9|nr:outer membrane beta-barrel protein [Halorhodospira abdelmalekii]
MTPTEVSSRNSAKRSVLASAAAVALLTAGIGSAHASGFTFEGPGIGDQDFYMGAYVHSWSLEPDEDEFDDRYEFDGFGGGLFLGVRVFANVTIETRIFTGFGSQDDGDWEVDLQHALSTVGRFNIDLGTPFNNEFYIMGGISSYAYEGEYDGTEERKELFADYSLSGGLGLTHRVAPQAWIFVEYFNYSIGGDVDLDSWGAGGMYRF